MADTETPQTAPDAAEAAGRPEGTTLTFEVENPQLSSRVPWLIAAGAIVFAVLVALPMPGFNGTLMIVVALLSFMLGLYAISRYVEGARRAMDRLVTVVVTSAFALAVVPLISVTWTVVGRGLERFDAMLFTETMRNVVGEGGGVMHALYGTLIITGLTALMSIPVGILTAIYLVEYGKGKLARGITLMVDVMTGIPSIVTGLFAVGLFTLAFGPGTRSGFAGAVALSVLMIPVVVRSAEEMLRLVPDGLRESAYGLGVPKWRTITKIVLPTSMAGLVTGVILAVARVVGETAPLLLAAGITSGLNLNPFDGRMSSLPLFAFYAYQTPGVPPQPSYDRGWAASLLLMAIVALLFLLARVLSRVLTPKGLK
jgi:phosphate transport system permease protein